MGIADSPTVAKVSFTLDVAKRARTFVDAGRSLIWDPQRKTPLTTNIIVHKEYKAPYALTCSSFV